MKSTSLAIAFTLALPLALGMARAASAHETGYSHQDDNVYHDRSGGRHIDHEQLPDGTHVDHEYGRHGRHIDHEYRPDGEHIDHEYGRHGKHIDHEYGVNGEHIDHDYTRGRHVDYDRSPRSYDPYYGGDPYRYDRRPYHTHS